MVFNYITTGPDRNVVLVYGIKLPRKGLSRRSHGRAAACDFEAGVRPAWTMERAGETPVRFHVNFDIATASTVGSLNTRCVLAGRVCEFLAALIEA
jgi:hypothetical protein